MADFFTALLPADIGLTEICPNGLIEKFRSLPRAQSIRLFANLSTLIWNAFGEDEKSFVQSAQLDVLSCLGQGRLARNVIAALRAHPRLIFIEPEQAALAVKFALLYSCEPDIDRSDAEARGKYEEDVIAVLVAISSAIIGEQQSIIEKDAIGFGLRIAHFQRRERLANVFARYYHFFAWADSVEGRASPEHLPLRADFPRLIGCSLEEYLFAFMALYTQSGLLKKSSDIGRLGAVMSPETLLAGTRDPSIVEKIIGENSIDIAEFRSMFSEENDNRFSALSLLPLLAKPFVRLEDGNICVISPKYLENCLGGAIFYRLADAYKVEGGDKKRGRFTSFFGNYLEAYVALLMQEATTTPARRIVREIPFIGKSGSQSKSTDVVAIENRDAIFLEVVAKRLRVAQTLRDVDPAAIRADLDNMLVEKVREIGDRLADFASGRFNLDGTVRSDLDRIFPVVVVVEPMLLEFGITNDVRARASSMPNLADVEPSEIIDIEGLEAVGFVLQKGALLSSILESKRKTTINDAMGIKDYLTTQGYDVAQTAQMDSRLQAFFAAVLGEAKAAGVPHSD